ncbi:YesN/AraC family two-component response regulator [Hydrogenispora ethanolica]|uniref:YesN/AraC family two-component response regulator n=1 Tax=Hydrogenispora ethanolica TaxID=1082276 RepID=A0A4R1RC50_HYDET|nr:response regulator [Hydrogenispora ethanolica]TCL63346.1 YesN/AraC family two-component response regulator [Hydrogenispora ethanolica]
MKILIVDDETPIREWIEFCIRKLGAAYEVVGLATNGLEALEIFQSTMADVVFIDIKMPIMDGMELMKQVKLLKPATEVIVLTAYSDFEYARSAIKYGALDYILKTEINDRMIAEILDKASQKNKSSGEHDRYNLDTIYWKRETFFRRLIAQNAKTVDISETELQEQNIPLKNGYLFAVALKDGAFDQGFHFDRQAIIARPDAIQNIFGFTYDKNIFVILANITGLHSLAEQQKTVAEFARGLREFYRCTLGVSTIQSGLKWIAAAVDGAVHQLELEFYNGEGSINQMAPVDNGAELLKKLEAIRDSITETVQRNGASAVTAPLEQLFTFIREHKIGDIGGVKNICGQIIDFMYDFVEIDRRTELYSSYKINEEIAKLNHLQALQSYVMRKMSDVLDGARKGNPNKNYSPAIAKAVDYIHQHYTESINLTHVAGLVHLNPEYFCRLFKEETGRNFSNYLAGLRLGKAVELLKKSDHKVCEIAERVGYSNLSYFSTLFKKHYGISPFDFRNRNMK